jgi:hypothetical protein
MKITIEIEQESAQVPPKVRIMTDEQPISLVQRLELELNANNKLPKLMIRFPDLNKLSANSLTQDGSIDQLKVSIAKYKKLLKFFPWIDLP